MLHGAELQLKYALLLLVPFAASAQILPPDLRVPDPVSEDVIVSSETWVDGVPTRIRLAHSAWKPNELFRHYYRVFENARYYIAPESKQLKVGHSLQLTAVEVGSQTTYTVVLTPLGDGTTNVLMGSADFSRRRPPTSAEDDIPLPSGTQNPTRSRTEGTATTLYEAPLPDAAVTKHYDAELAQRGFKKKEAGTYEKGDASFTLSFKTTQDGKRWVLTTYDKSAPVPPTKK